MKQFTLADISRSESDFPSIYTEEYRTELAHRPLPWQVQGLQETRTGYGARLTSPYKIHFEGKEYRLYTTCYSNASSTWFTYKGRKVYVN